MAAAYDFANDLFLALSALNRQTADAHQREYEAMTPEQRRALWAERRAELDRMKTECAERGIDL